LTILIGKISNKEKRQLQKIVANFLSLNLLTVEQVATSAGVFVDFVLSIQRQLSAK
jgi:hypothetical protein